MPNGADTCRKFVVPRLQAAIWDDKPHLIAEQRTITDGRIVSAGRDRDLVASRLPSVAQPFCGVE